jgi:hypothetical protein
MTGTKFSAKAEFGVYRECPYRLKAIAWAANGRSEKAWPRTFDGSVATVALVGVESPRMQAGQRLPVDDHGELSARSGTNQSRSIQETTGLCTGAATQMTALSR